MSLEWAVISKLLPFESVFLQWMAILSGQLAARRYLSKVGWIFEGNVRRGRGQGAFLGSMCIQCTETAKWERRLKTSGAVGALRRGKMYHLPGLARSPRLHFKPKMQFFSNLFHFYMVIFPFFCSS